MLQIIFISLALAFIICALIMTFIKRISIGRTLFLVSSGFFLAYTIDLVISINYSFVSQAEIAYIILMVFAIIVFVFLLLNFIRKRS